MNHSRKKLASAALATVTYLSPMHAASDVLELSQQQMRQLVLEKQVLSAETIATDAAANFGGVVMDIRGFLSEGRMTYRLLLRRNDGSVIEVLFNGVDGERVSHSSQMGQVVSTVARTANRSSDRSSAANNGNRGNAGNNGNRGNANNNGNRGNAGNNGNGRGGGNSGGNGNGRGNSNGGGKGNGRGN